MITTVFDSPVLYGNNYNYYLEGSSPRLFNFLIKHINENLCSISHIKISIYLFNNLSLHSFFKEIIDKTDIKITVVSIPLEGYDNTNPKPLRNLTNPEKQSKSFTKYELAEKVYSDILEMNCSQYKLFIFPHMYIRSKYVRPFSRGKMPYSLHNKLFLVEYKNEKPGDIAISSSGFACRDLVKEENLMLIEENHSFYNAANKFFNDLISNSLDSKIFDNDKTYFDYKISLCANNQSNEHIFIAPFYEKSPNYSERLLKGLINKAKKRIYIVAQHICAYEYTYSHNGNKSTKKGFLFDAIETAKRYNVELKCLSQTYIDEKGCSQNSRKPANIKDFSKFIDAFKTAKSGKYAVNQNLHSKYIIIDDTLIVTSCNFTPTQFIYLRDVHIEKFEHIPNASYNGIHSEVGAYVVTNDKQVVNSYVNNMFAIWNRDSTKFVI